MLVVGLVIIIIAGIYYSSSNQNQRATVTQITNKDFGSTVYLVKNEDIKVNVSTNPSLSYSMQIDNPGILGYSVLTSQNNILTTTLHAKNPGTTTVFVFGKPLCKPFQACPKFIIQELKLTVIVK